MMLLMLTQILSKDNTGKLRIAFGAFIASLIVPITLYYPNTFMTTVIGKLLFSMVIILSAFRFTTIYQSIKQLLLFYFISFIVCGCFIRFFFILIYGCGCINRDSLFIKKTNHFISGWPT